MSDERPMRGIRYEGLDAAFQAEETRKSDLMLQAALLRERGQDEAADKFAEAAAIEERLRDRCEAQGLIPKSLVHAFSAAGCWAQAGDFHHALTLCDQMLAREDVPDRLRGRVGNTPPRCGPAVPSGTPRCCGRRRG